MRNNGRHRQRRWLDCGRPFRAVLQLLVLVSWLIPPSDSQAQTSRQGGAFVDVGMDAAVAGVGYAGAGSATGVRALAWNVAGLAQATSLELTLSHVDQLEQFTYDHLALAIPFRRGRSVMGAAVSVSGDDAYTEWTTQLAYAHRVAWLGMGLGVRYRRAAFGRNVLDPSDLVVFDPDEIADGMARKVWGEAQGWGLDAGLTVRMHRDIRMSWTLRNVVAPVRWSSTSGVRQLTSRTEHVPADMDVAVRYTPADWFTFNAAWAPAMDWDVAARYGFGAAIRPVRALELRAGRVLLHDGYRNESTTLGFGLRAGDIWGVGLQIDYAWVSSDLAISQLFTLVVAP